MNRKDELATRAILEISDEILGISSLYTKHNDNYDFHEVSVWGLREALTKAFYAGYDYGKVDGYNSCIDSVGYNGAYTEDYNKNTTNKETNRELYYKLLKQEREKTDFNSIESIHAYNEFARELRHELLDEDLIRFDM